MKRHILYLLIFLISLETNGQSKTLDKMHQLMSADKFDLALIYIDSLLLTRDSTYRLYYYKALCEQRLKKHDSAVTSATKILGKIEPNDSLYHHSLFLRSISLGQLNKLELGIKDIEELLQYFPDNIYYLNQIGYYCGELVQFHKSLIYLYRGYILDTTYQPIIQNIVHFNCRSGDYESVIKMAEKGLRLVNDSATTSSLLNNLGFAISKTYSVVEGIERINESILFWPGNLYTYYHLGLIFLEEGSVELACTYFRRSKELGGFNLTSTLLKVYCN